ncbi:MAG: STM4012 family radical SAM protein [Pseudomonadota bacterium]|nr:STM4012 family radical SAM protein [Pseudomonadota bacterium]
MIENERLDALLASGEYLSYAYAYPHKTAYRTLAPPVDLRALWAEEDRRALFLYVHVPFCEQRCGFCNLYTQVRPKSGVEARYVAAVERQAAVVAEALADRAGPHKTTPPGFVRLAIGGGTPTFLGAALLDRVFAAARRMGAADVPTSIEVSPGTLDDDQLAVLVANRVTRASVGVQSILPSETGAVQRGQAPADVERVVRRLAAAVAVCNVDLIYGLPGQTAATLRRSIDHVVDLGANELYLYPLYVRPLTGLGRRDGWDDHRLGLYRAGREHLLARGWTQASMRMFRAPGSVETGGAEYRCQDDGMVGLGAGARSYTRALHYASPYAVTQGAIRSGIEAWMAQSDADFAVARHGIALDPEERRRRFVLLSLLDTGLDRAAYLQRFGADVLAHLPELGEAVDAGLVEVGAGRVGLTETGLERSDVLGHWLQSAAVRAARAAWEAA